MSTNENSDGSLWYNFVILIFLLCILILVPCIVFPRQRIICYRRIRQRRWNVATDDIAETSVNGGEISQRNPRDGQRYIATEEETEKINKESLLKQLKDYTKVRF